MLDVIVIGWPFLPPFLNFCLLLLQTSVVSFHDNSNENNNDSNSITSMSLSMIALFQRFPFLLKLYLTAVVRKQDYWYLSEMKVHF